MTKYFTMNVCHNTQTFTVSELSYFQQQKLLFVFSNTLLSKAFSTFWRGKKRFKQLTPTYDQNKGGEVKGRGLLECLPVSYKEHFLLIFWSLHLLLSSFVHEEPSNQLLYKWPIRNASIWLENQESYLYEVLRTNDVQTSWWPLCILETIGQKE